MSFLCLDEIIILVFPLTNAFVIRSNWYFSFGLDNIMNYVVTNWQWACAFFYSVQKDPKDRQSAHELMVCEIPIFN